MRVNAGGLIAPEQVIGRDKFIDNLWQRIAQQSVILTSERRIGKSSVIRKMCAQPNEEYTVILRDVEGISTIKEFVNRLVDDLFEHQNIITKGKSLIGSVRKELSDWKIFGVTVSKKEEPNWMSVLENIINELAKLYKTENKVLLMIWDEFPWMLQKIIKHEGEAVAANLLDNLRLARQNHSNVRMIFTGSIGLHHVLKSLKASSLTNEPVNDMQVINLPPLQNKDAIELINQLLHGENLKVLDNNFAFQLAKSVDCVPYYIHHLITSILNNESPVIIATIEQEINLAFVDANDTWNLRHYDSRLKEYYGEHFIFYQLILDILSQEPAGLTRQDLENLLAADH
ncbi:MAG: hypothetical protein OQK03_04680, partial [Colwellia sp.]|nr:hypothetical protein [Colwellia sp.]